MSASADPALPSITQDGTMGLKSVPPSPPRLTRNTATTSPSAPSPTAKQAAAPVNGAQDSQSDPDSQPEESASALSRSSSMSVMDHASAAGLPTAFALLSMAPVDMTTAEGVVGISRPPNGESTHSRIKRAAQVTIMTATVLTAVVQHSSAVRTDLEKLKLATNVQLAEARRAKELLSKLAPSSASMGPPTADASLALSDCRKVVDQANVKIASLQSDLADVRGAVDSLSSGPLPNILEDIEALHLSSSAQQADTIRIIEAAARNAAPRDETCQAIAHVDAKVMALDNAILLLKGDLQRSAKDAASKPSDDYQHAIADLDARLTVFNVDCSTVVAKAREEVANTSAVVDSLAVSVGELSAKLSGYEHPRRMPFS